MAVDLRLDLFGMNFPAADIDDAAAPPDKVVAAIAQLHHVAGIDKPVCLEHRGDLAEVVQRGAVRLYPQRPLDEAPLDGAGAER